MMINAILNFYDFTKGGTDIVDQQIGFYSVNTKSRRSPTNLFSYILDTMRVNTQTIFSLNKGDDPRKTNSFEFCWELVLALVKPHFTSRRENNAGLSNSVSKKMNLILNESEPVIENEEQVNILSNSKSRCYTCLREAVGKAAKDKLSVPTLWEKDM